MNVTSSNIRQGRVTARVDSLDDLWYLSQIVSEGDLVKAKSVRRIKEKDDKLRSGGGERKIVTLTVRVEKKEFKSDSNTLRFTGVITEGPEDVVSLGSHHTINVELDSVLTVIKDKWSGFDVERLKEAEKETIKPKFLVVVVDEGEACIGLVRSSKIEYFELSRNIGGKYNTKERDARKKEFYSELKDFIVGLAGREALANVVLAGPGFEKENFMQYLSDAPSKSNINFAVENTGSSGRRGVVEVLKRPSVSKMLGELNAARDIQYMEEVLEKIGRGSGLATYGLDEVRKASSYGAIEKLLLSDRLFLGERKTLEPIMLDVKAKAGLVHIINHESEAGAQLESLGGIAAILRFKVE